MLRFRPSLSIAVGLLIFGLLLSTHHPAATQADDGLTLPLATPEETVAPIMAQIGAGKIDEAVAMMDGLNAQPNLKEAARDRLLHLRDEQGKYRSYDIAAVQKFTSQFQTLDVMAYYDLQPVLLRFHFYRSQLDPSVKWTILGFQETSSLQEIVDILKDTPIDYSAHKTGN